MTTIDFSSVLNKQIKENINHSITSSKANYENDSNPSVTFKGTTTIINLYIAYDDNGEKKMLERVVTIGPNQNEVVKNAHNGMNYIPFRISLVEKVRDIRNGSGWESCYNVAYGKEHTLRNDSNDFAFELACNNKFELTEEIPNYLYDDVIKSYLSISNGIHQPLFLGIEFYSFVKEYFHSGIVNYHSIAFVDDSITKGSITLNCYSCNKQTLPTKKVHDWEDVENEVVKYCKDWTSINVKDAETDHCTMCADGFNGRY